MASLRRFLARSDHPAVRAAREAYRKSSVSLPVPGWAVKPALWGYLAGRLAIHFTRRVFIAEPLFKAYVRSHGRGLKTGIFVHWIEGKGDIILGDHVTFDGKSGIKFAARFVDRPTLTVGDYTGISGGCSISVAKQITIGKHCRLASEVIITDSNGHPAEPTARKEGAPPTDDSIRPVTIHDNVWIGKRAIILPGVTIGEGSIVSSGAVVISDIAPYTVVAGNPARKIGQVPRPKEEAIPPPHEASAAR
jgi:acetyltransferase-like isoleucine patch superfamily enzyme